MLLCQRQSQRVISDELRYHQLITLNFALDKCRRRAYHDGHTNARDQFVNDDGFGATSIDMGYGGEGNAVKKSQ